MVSKNKRYVWLHGKVKILGTVRKTVSKCEAKGVAIKILC